MITTNASVKNGDELITKTRLLLQLALVLVAHSVRAANVIKKLFASLLALADRLATRRVDLAVGASVLLTHNIVTRILD